LPDADNIAVVATAYGVDDEPYGSVGCGPDAHGLLAGHRGRALRRREPVQVIERAALLRRVVEMSADYYLTLGVARDADEGAIKKAFRQEARRLHPM